MKLVCLDFEDCLFAVNIKDITPPLNYANKFHECPECFNLAVLLPDNFDLSMTVEESFLIYYKIDESLNEDFKQNNFSTNS